MEESAATRLQRAKRRETCTDGQCYPALPSLRPSSAGAGWGLRLRLQRSDPGRGLGLAAWRQSEGARVWCATPGRVREEAWAHQRGKAPLLGGTQGEGYAHRRRVFLCLRALRWQGTAYTSSGGGCKLLLPSQIPEVGAGRYCHQGSHDWAPTTAPASPGVCAGHAPAHPHQADNGQHT